MMALLACGTAHAYRPFDGTDADVAERGEFELELGPIGYIYEGGDHTIVLSNVIANFGFMPGWEMVVQGRGLLPLGGEEKPKLAIDNTGIFVKHVVKEGVLQRKRGVSVAMELGVLPPQATGDIAGFSVATIVSYRWRNLTAHWNVQAAETPQAHFDLFGGVILEGPWRWRARPVVELYAERELDDHLTLSALAGVIFRARDNVVLDLAARAARVYEDGASPKLGVEVRAGVTLTFDTKLP
jgi:hypothetical protein